MFRHIPIDNVNWITISFLKGTLFLSLTAVPWYIWSQGLDWFMAGLFFFFFLATGLSITLGYHRLFTHLSFKATWPVRLFTLLFGAAAFESSVLDWASDHRRHHKHCDHDDDPYDVSKGFWHAHIGWLMFKLRPDPPRDNVKDLERDSLIRWQDRWVQLIAVCIGFALPTAIAGLWYGSWMGALGGFLVAGVLRVVFVQHATFFINSLCHSLGNQPYDTQCSARDSWIMALFTFGEGYHNYHHSFQHDFRNGIRAWHWDPTKWTILLLAKLRLVSNLRSVPQEKILLAQMRETLRRLEQPAAVESPAEHLLREVRERLTRLSDEVQASARARTQLPREALKRWKREHDEALAILAGSGLLRPEKG